MFRFALIAVAALAASILAAPAPEAKADCGGFGLLPGRPLAAVGAFFRNRKPVRTALARGVRGLSRAGAAVFGGR